MEVNAKFIEKLDRINQYIIFCKVGHWEYFENIYIIYKPYILYLAKTYFYKDGDKEDLIQQGLIGLYSAIQRFDIHKSRNFENFAKLCIRKSMLQIIRSSNAKKNTIHSDSIFFYNLININNYMVLDTIKNNKVMSPEDILIQREENENMLRLIKENLTNLEKSVFVLHINGYSLKDIGKELDINYKSVDNAMARVRKKMKQKLKILIY